MNNRAQLCVVFSVKPTFVSSLILPFAILLLAPAGSWAANKTWVEGNFNTGASWSPNQSVTAVDNLFIVNYLGTPRQVTGTVSASTYNFFKTDYSVLIRSTGSSVGSITIGSFNFAPTATQTFQFRGYSSGPSNSRITIIEDILLQGGTLQLGQPDTSSTAAASSIFGITVGGTTQIDTGANLRLSRAANVTGETEPGWVNFGNPQYLNHAISTGLGWTF